MNCSQTGTTKCCRKGIFCLHFFHFVSYNFCIKLNQNVKKVLALREDRYKTIQIIALLGNNIKILIDTSYYEIYPFHFHFICFPC